jgi:dTDP-4-amino-4,6-dideoxygalactose transaminase
LLGLGITDGDEVIISGLTFVADANVVKMVGAVPVVADVGSLTDWNVSAETLEARITKRTRAIILVHYGGVPCEMDQIIELCNRYQIALIEDVAHAPGASYKGVRCGCFGDVAAFSFFTNKNLSVGEGGMVLSKHEELNAKMKYLRSHGMTTLTLDRHRGRAITYDVVMPGLNYRMDEMRAALGLVQLEKLEDANAARQKLAEHYRKLLGSVDGVSVPFTRLTDKKSAYHIFPVLIDKAINREQVFMSMKELGIQTSIHYPSIKSFSAYRQDLAHFATPNCDAICDHELTLPIYPTMKMEQVEEVVESLTSVLNKQETHGVFNRW